ncbi:hypothetical protein V865_004558 [Kwoniella europaea PYCC6329]|uniref:Uncharacterized protein n=1 Tax=Kwoniella europaea PYCC6329 TaxID=1423913 RepID=A0AAX4KKW5_9TREE
MSTLRSENPKSKYTGTSLEEWFDLPNQIDTGFFHGNARELVESLPGRDNIGEGKSESEKRDLRDMIVRGYNSAYAFANYYSIMREEFTDEEREILREDFTKKLLRQILFVYFNKGFDGQSKGPPPNIVDSTLWQALRVFKVNKAELLPYPPHIGRHFSSWFIHDPNRVFGMSDLESLKVDTSRPPPAPPAAHAATYLPTADRKAGHRPAETPIDPRSHKRPRASGFGPSSSELERDIQAKKARMEKKEGKLDRKGKMRAVDSDIEVIEIDA